MLRLFNTLCFLATVTLTWMLAGEIFRGSRFKQTLAAGVVALEPQLSFMSAVINADNLLIAVTTAFLVATVRLVIRGPSLKRVSVAAALSAVAMLTHGRGLITVPVLAVALIVTWLRHRPSWRLSAKGAAIAAAAVAAGLLVEYAWGSSAGGSLYSGQVRTLNTGLFSLGQFLTFIYQFFLHGLSGSSSRLGPEYGYRQVFITTFYGTFGSLEITFKSWVYDILQIGSAVGLVAFCVACAARWRALLRAWAPVALMGSMVVGLIAFLLYSSYQALLADGGSDPLIVGRYLLPMVCLFGVAIAFTVGSLPRRAGAVVASVVLSSGVLLVLAGLGMTAARFYV